MEKRATYNNTEIFIFQARGFAKIGTNWKEKLGMGKLSGIAKAVVMVFTSLFFVERCHPFSHDEAFIQMLVV